VARSPPAAPDAPVSAEDLAARLEGLGPFERRPQLAVAASGGPDSMALARLVRDWAAARQGAVLALIVDHGLRPESAAEAALTRDRLAAQGIPSRILVWAGAKPATGLQAAAREARYGLLAEACREAGILHLLLAHQREDQAETVALRKSRGSGPTGLAGMPAVREVEGLRLLRPLLDLPKARLVATLAAAGVAWLEDPSNPSLAFARGRLRAGSIPVEALLDLARGHGAARAADEAAAARWLAARARPHPLGFVRVDLGGVDTLPEGPMLGLLRAVAGRALPPRRERLERFLDHLARAEARATLGGCLALRRADRLTVLREPAAAREIVELAPGETRLWDGRFLVGLEAAADRRLTVRRIGAAVRLPPTAREEARKRAIPAAALAALPGLWDGERLVWHPPLGGPTAPGTPAVAWCRLAPRIGLAPPPFDGANVV
jgi:tRNA(Ile)-lysidine synthase